ncbi:hypothetical protein P7H64_12420, partial [Lactococcus lactis]|nr:hypothetical protein [Lactococcus lactis]
TIVISIALIIGGFYSYNSRINNLSKTNNGKEVVKNSSEKNQIDLTYKKGSVAKFPITPDLL